MVEPLIFCFLVLPQPVPSLMDVTGHLKTKEKGESLLALQLPWTPKGSGHHGYHRGSSLNPQQVDSEGFSHYDCGFGPGDYHPLSGLLH